MTDMQIEQRVYIEAMKRTDIMNNRYGNKRKARSAARRNLRSTLASIGYSDTAIDVIWKDAHDMYVLERDCDDATE